MRSKEPPARKSTLPSAPGVPAVPTALGAKLGKLFLSLVFVVGLSLPGELAYADVTTSGDMPTAAPATLPTNVQVETLVNGKAVQKALLGDAITVRPVFEGSAEGVTFNYVWSCEGRWDAGNWSSTIKETGHTTIKDSYEFKPTKSGRYDLYIDLMLNGSEVTVHQEILVIEDWSFDSVSISKASIPLGANVTVEPNVSGTQTSLARYNYVWSHEGRWDAGSWSSTVLETGGYTSDTAWLFTPMKAGNYHIYMDAVKTNGTVETKQVDLLVTSAWNATSFKVNPSKVLVGESVDASITFDPQSNLVGLQYNYVWQLGNTWDYWDSTLLNGQASTEASHTYTFDRHGHYNLYADVMGTDGKKVTLQSTVEVDLPYTFEGVSLSSSNVTLENSVSVSPIIEGDAAGASYNYVWSYDGRWGEGDWSSTMNETGVAMKDAAWSFMPKKAGRYDIYIDVLAPDGTKDTKQVSLNVARGWEANSLQTSLNSPQKVGTSVDYYVNVTGDRSSRVRYNYVWATSGWGRWDSTINSEGDYTTAEKSTFTPSLSGDYNLYVDLYDPYSGEKITVSTPFHVDKKWKLDGLDVRYPSPLRPGSNVSMTASVSGDTTGLRYNFVWARNGWYSWDSTKQMTGDYTAASSVTYQIENQSGFYDFYLDVVDSNGEAEHAKVGTIRGYSAWDNREAVVWTALNQVGYRSGWEYETPLLDAGGTLCNGRHGWYCATFVWWCFREAGLSNLWGEGGLQSDPEYLANEYRQMGAYSSNIYGAQRGDIVFAYIVPWRNPQSITHAALVVDTSPTTITVVEGNTDGGVWVHTWPKFHWVGYARPAY